MARQDIPTWAVRLLKHQHDLQRRVPHIHAVKQWVRRRTPTGTTGTGPEFPTKIVPRDPTKEVFPSLPATVDIKKFKAILRRLPETSPFWPLRALVLGKPDNVPLNALADFWDVALAARLPSR